MQCCCWACKDGFAGFCEVLQGVKQTSASQHTVSCGEEPAGLLEVLNRHCSVCLCPTMLKSLPLAGNSDSDGTLKEKDKRIMKNINYMGRTF